MNSAVIINVGANLKDNKGLSPIFKDKTYEYIPSLLDNNLNASKHHNHKHYSKLKCQNKLLFGMHMSSFVAEGTGHVDPEFYTFTYGENRSAYISQLKKLKGGDLLLFGIILQKYNTKEDKFTISGDPALYIFGYFVIEQDTQSVCEFKGPLDINYLGCFAKSCNEHVIYRSQHIQTPPEKKLLLLKGDGHQSTLFKSPLKIGDEKTISGTIKKSWKLKAVENKPGIYWCENFTNVQKAMLKHSENNRWVDWEVP